MAERGEGRLARWSRLKRKGGADEAEETAAEARREADETESPAAPVAEAPEWRPDPAALPGGVQKRQFVPPMAPLAAPEEGEAAYEQAPPEALAMLEGEAAHDAAPPADMAERELTPEEEEAVRNLPPIESLTKESDFTPFLADNVPEFIKNRALRMLWRSDPFFGFQDGLDDYAENFRVIDKLIDAGSASSYRPGQGYAGLDDETAEETAEAAAGPDTEAPAEKEAAAAPPAGDEEDVDADDLGEGEDDPDQAAAADSEATERLSSGSVRKPGDA